jgi:hypothetical protein
MQELLACRDFWVLLCAVFGPALCITLITVILEES